MTRECQKLWLKPLLVLQITLKLPLDAPALLSSIPCCSSGPTAKKLFLDELWVSGASESADWEAIGSSMSELSSFI